MRYSRIAQALQEISQAQRSRKIDLASRLLSDIEPEMLCTAVRLLLGELWPPWEEREMGIGPQALMVALAKVSDQDLPTLWERYGDMGQVAEAALGQKGQHLLFCEPLEALAVYERLWRISELNGKESEQRKIAQLMGLFLQATPLEGKYIARTAMRNMQAGIGHMTMTAALSRALNCDQVEILRAFGLMPDLGSIAAMAVSQELKSAVFRPKVPTRFMLFHSHEPTVPGAFLPKYPGLRVQVHKIKKEVIIFTSKLRNITFALNGISRLLGKIEGDYVVDADLIGFYENRNGICSHAEMLGYINRRRLSRKSSILPAILAYDLIAQQGEDICGMPYQDRRTRLLSMLGEPKDMPFSGISPAQEKVLRESSAASDFLCQAGMAGARALLERDLQAAYRPGEVAESDFIIRVEKICRE